MDVVIVVDSVEECLPSMTLASPIPIPITASPVGCPYASPCRRPPPNSQWWWLTLEHFDDAKLLRDGVLLKLSRCVVGRECCPRPPAAPPAPPPPPPPPPLPLPPPPPPLPLPLPLPLPMPTPPPLLLLPSTMATCGISPDAVLRRFNRFRTSSALFRPCIFNSPFLAALPSAARAERNSTTGDRI